MNALSHSSRPSRLLLALSLALLGALLLAGPARAAFPGVPGPIVYTQSSFDSAVGDSGGLYVHGPRRTQAQRPLTTDPYDRDPAYSANGRLIVFVRATDPGSTPSAHLFVMSADGTGVRQLTDGNVFDAGPTFAPNGRQIVFSRHTPGDPGNHLFAIGVDGSGLRQLTSGNFRDTEPTYAPNGRWLAFTSDREPSARTDRGDIFSMRPNGSRIRLLLDGPRKEAEPDISPNGRRILFTSNRRHGPNIYVARVNGSHVRALTRSRSDCFGSVCFRSPSWAPDGRHIAFVREGRYASDLEVMRADGRRATTFIEAGVEEGGEGTRILSPYWGPRRR